MGVASYVARLWNWLYLKSKFMEWTDFLHVDIDSQNLKLIKIYWVDMVKNGCGQSIHGAPKMAVSQNWRNGINRIFACWYKFGKAKIWFNYFWLGLVKNGSGFLVHETLKSAVS